MKQLKNRGKGLPCHAFYVAVEEVSKIEIFFVLFCLFVEIDLGVFLTPSLRYYFIVVCEVIYNEIRG